MSTTTTPADGRGVRTQSEAIQKLHEEDPHRLLVTSTAASAPSKKQNWPETWVWKLVITDHHTFGETLPEAAVWCTATSRGTYPIWRAVRSRVSFKLAWAICQRLGDGTKASPEMREFLKSAVGLAAIGPWPTLFHWWARTASSCGTV